MICEEKFLWKQLGEGMLLRTLSPSSLGLLPPKPLGSGQPMVTTAVCYFVGHGSGGDREVGQFPPPQEGAMQPRALEKGQSSLEESLGPVVGLGLEQTAGPEMTKRWGMGTSH